VYILGVNLINILLQLFADILLPKNLPNQIVSREKLGKAFLYKKLEHKMLMKLTLEEQSFSQVLHQEQILVSANQFCSMKHAIQSNVIFKTNNLLIMFL